MIRPYASTSRTRLGSRVAANNAPQAAPYSTTSSPYGSPPARAPQASPRPPDVRQAAQAPAQGIVGRVDTGRQITPPSLPRSAFAPNMGRQPETPPSTQVQPQQGWSASNDKEDPIWRNTWRSHGEGVWGANAAANSGGYPMPPGMRPANIDQTRLQPPPDYGLTATRRNPQMIWPAEAEPQDDAVPTGQEAPITLRGGRGPAGSAPPPDERSGIGVQQSGLVGTLATGSTPEGEEYRNEQEHADRGGDYADVSDEELDRIIAENQDHHPWDDEARDRLRSALREKARREVLGQMDNRQPDQGYINNVADGTGFPPEQIAADYEAGYRWASVDGEWRRFSMSDMVDALTWLQANGYEHGDNVWVDKIMAEIRAGRMPDPNDIARMLTEFDGDDEISALFGGNDGGFRGLSADDLRSRNEYEGSPHQGTQPEGRDWSAEMESLMQMLMGDLAEPWEPFDQSALEQQSALDRSQQMRAALEMASAQGASTGQVQSALSDIGLRSESQLNAEVADRNMASQLAKHQRNLGLIQAASQLLLAQQAQNLSAEEAAKNRQLQMMLARMQIQQQQRMDAIAAERERNRTFWDALGGVFGGLLGLGGQLGGAALGRPSAPGAPPLLPGHYYV